MYRKEIEEPDYYQYLNKQINKLPIISDIRQLERRRNEGWKFDEDEITKKINDLTLL